MNRIVLKHVGKALVWCAPDSRGVIAKPIGVVQLGSMVQESQRTMLKLVLSTCLWGPPYLSSDSNLLTDLTETHRSLGHECHAGACSQAFCTCVLEGESNWMFDMKEVLCKDVSGFVEKGCLH